jgi:hypothetical protein
MLLTDADEICDIIYLVTNDFSVLEDKFPHSVLNF